MTKKAAPVDQGDPADRVRLALYQALLAYQTSTDDPTPISVGVLDTRLSAIFLAVEATLPAIKPRLDPALRAVIRQYLDERQAIDRLINR